MTYCSPKVSVALVPLTKSPRDFFRLDFRSLLKISSVAFRTQSCSTSASYPECEGLSRKKSVGKSKFLISAWTWYGWIRRCSIYYLLKNIKRRASESSDVYDLLTEQAFSKLERINFSQLPGEELCLSPRRHWHTDTLRCNSSSSKKHYLYQMLISAKYLHSQSI